MPLTRLFMVLLRLAIGVHFLFEGLAKLDTYQPDAKVPQWSAEGYLRNATGPLAPYYHQMLGDANGVARLMLPVEDEEGKPLVPAALAQEWDEMYHRFSSVSELKDDQKRGMQEALANIKQSAGDWFRRNRIYVDEYVAAVKEDRELNKNLMAEFEKNRYYASKIVGLRKERDFFLEKLADWTSQLESRFDRILNPLQKEEVSRKPSLLDWNRIDDWPAWWTTLDWINFATVYGLIAMGLAFLFGLFTRLAALGAVVFLASLYMAMPPWPGLPGAEAMGAHYFYVNMQLIELLAVLTVAGSGRWAGLDALIGAAFRKGG